MGLKEVLSKMKIVELDPGETASPAAAVPPVPHMPPGKPAGPPSQPRDLRELLGEIPEAPAIDERKLAAAAPAEGGDDEVPDFPAIYKAAGVVDPPHGYSAYKVLEIFASPGFASLDLRAKAAALTGFLNMTPSGPVPITDVVQDAVRRDQALDKFEEFLRTKLQGRQVEIEKENARLQAEIDELTLRNREKMEQSRQGLAQERAKIERWQTAKRIEERKLYDAVSPFVDGNPITLGMVGAAVPHPEPPTPAAAAEPERNQG
jgi:hypothetical protein